MGKFVILRLKFYLVKCIHHVQDKPHYTERITFARGYIQTLSTVHVMEDVGNSTIETVFSPGA